MKNLTTLALLILGLGCRSAQNNIEVPIVDIKNKALNRALDKMLQKPYVGPYASENLTVFFKRSSDTTFVDILQIAPDTSQISINGIINDRALKIFIVGDSKEVSSFYQLTTNLSPISFGNIKNSDHLGGSAEYKFRKLVFVDTLLISERANMLD